MIITVTHLSNGRIHRQPKLDRAPSPTNQVLPPATEVFDTADEAELRVEQLVLENGGPDAVEIRRYDYWRQPSK